MYGRDRVVARERGVMGSEEGMSERVSVAEGDGGVAVVVCVPPVCVCPHHHHHRAGQSRTG